MSPFFMFNATLYFWSSAFDAMKLATEEMFSVRPPPKLVLVVIQGGKSR